MKKFLIGLIVVMVTIIVGTVVIYRQSISPYNQAYQEATAFANNHEDLISVDDFYWYNGEETYFTVTGTNSDEEEIIVIIRQEGGNITTFNQNETISETEAIRQVIEEKDPEEILEARIGIEEEEAVWEISFQNEYDRLGYYVMSLETGEWIRTIDNI